METEKKRYESEGAQKRVSRIDESAIKMTHRKSQQELDTQPTSGVKTLRASNSVGSLNSLGGGLGSFRKSKLFFNFSSWKIDEGSIAEEAERWFY